MKLETQLIQARKRGEFCECGLTMPCESCVPPLEFWATRRDGGVVEEEEGREDQIRRAQRKWLAKKRKRRMVYPAGAKKNGSD